MNQLTPPATAHRNSAHRRYKFLKRLINFRQCDFQFALWQMLYLLVSPNRVYRHAHYQKTHKNQYARDDPAFLVLLAVFLCISSVMVAIVFGLSFGSFVALLLWIVFVDCIAIGAVIASTLWYVSNRFLRTRSPHTVEEAVEWAYCFDVHCNAFFPLLLILHVLQILIIKVINTTYFVSTMAADTLWLVAVCYYVYITFVGYNALPFLHRTVLLLYPGLIAVAVYFVALLLNWNISRSVFRYYGLQED
eukprot:m.445793 g.445793  ORF g.445793 m.445793 type:complete len:248 (+) comp19277_c0_seq1:95-838(+)